MMSDAPNGEMRLSGDSVHLLPRSKGGQKEDRVETTEGMRPFYFFRDAQVKIKYPNRDKLSRAQSKIPWQNLYDDELNYKEWLAPPFKEHFQSQPLILTKNMTPKSQF